MNKQALFSEDRERERDSGKKERRDFFYFLNLSLDLAVPLLMKPPFKFRHCIWSSSFASVTNIFSFFWSVFLQQCRGINLFADFDLIAEFFFREKKGETRWSSGFLVMVRWCGTLDLNMMRKWSASLRITGVYLILVCFFFVLFFSYGLLYLYINFQLLTFVSKSWTPFWFWWFELGHFSVFC